MAVVRREGDWRLEKMDDGVYEVTYDRQPEMKIITSDYSPDAFTDERHDFTIQVREMDSFSEAKSEFEAIAAGGNPRAGFGIGLGGGGGRSDSGTELNLFEGNGDLEDTPAGVLILGFLFFGGYLIYRNGFNPDSTVFLFATTLVTVGVGGIAWTYLIYRQGRVSEAIEFLLSTGDADSATTTSASDTEKTPPAPESLKNELYFERANQECEWCGDPTDTPEVHHIEPRSEGGSNEPRNLIVLCPGCHSKADRGAPSKTKLMHKVKRLENARA